MKPILSFMSSTLVVFALIFVDAPFVFGQTFANHNEEVRKFLLLGDTHFRKGEMKEAIAQFELARKRAIVVYGAKHANTAEVISDLAFLNKQAQNNGEAEALYNQAIDVYLSLPGNADPRLATTVGNLGALYKAMKKYEDAEKRCRESMDLWISTLDRTTPEDAVGLINLADLCSERGDYPQAERLYLTNITLVEKKFTVQHPALPPLCRNLAKIYFDRGLYAQAMALLERGLVILESRNGKKDDLETAHVQEAMAVVSSTLGQKKRARTLSQASLAIRETKLGKNHFRLAPNLHLLAGLAGAAGDHEEAIALYERGRRLVEGRDELQVAQFLVGEAIVRMTQGENDKAEILLRRSLQIREDKIHKTSSQIAECKTILGILYGRMKRHEEARSFLREAEAVLEGGVGKNHPQMSVICRSLAHLNADAQQWDEALKNFDLAHRVMYHHVRFVLPALSEREQLAYLRKVADRLVDESVSFAFMRQADSGLADLSATWILNARGLSVRTLAQPTLLARHSHDPMLAELLRELLATRGRLASITFAKPTDSKDSQPRKQVEMLTQKEESLFKELSRRSNGFAMDEPWIDVDQVRKALPTKSILVEIVKYVPRLIRDDQGKLKPRYGAWTIPPHGKGQIQMFDLGPADVIEAMARAFQEIIRCPINDDMDGLKARQALNELGTLILRPMAEPLKKAEQWIICPDGVLWTVPWGGLPIAEGTFAIQKHHISYLISGRDLVGRRDGGGTTPSVVLADPDFDVGRKSLEKELKLVGGTPPHATLRGSGVPGKLGNFRRLPGTSEEAQAISPNLEAFTKQKPRILTGAQALETVFKSVAKPSAVVISTHAFFLEDQETVFLGENAGKEPELILDQTFEAFENPLLRCGLALAGANQRMENADAGDDGLLTGIEVVGTDLAGTKLVVLSACDTGLGEIRNGQGVACLRQAFHLAGAKNVVATLWKVSDRETSQFMSQFFKFLAEGKGEAQALCLAQRAQLDRPGIGPHPRYWAAFILSGPPGETSEADPPQIPVPVDDVSSHPHSWWFAVVGTALVMLVCGFGFVWLLRFLNRRSPEAGK